MKNNLKLIIGFIVLVALIIVSAYYYHAGTSVYFEGETLPSGPQNGTNIEGELTPKY